MSRLAAALTAALAVAPLQARAVESVDCLILPGRSIDVGGTIPGQIARVDAEIGDVVTEGQVIASLRTEVQEAVLALADLRARNMAPVEAARARLRYEERELARSEELLDRGVLAESSTDERQTAYEVRLRELEEAETNRQLAQLDLLRAEAELEIRLIRAPIAGVIAERHLDPGEYLRDDGKVATVVSLDPLRAEVFLPQEAYRSVAVGQPATIESELLPGETFTGTVANLDQVIDAASAMFRVRIDIPNPDNRIVPGTRCRAVLAR